MASVHLTNPPPTWEGLLQDQREVGLRPLVNLTLSCDGGRVPVHSFLFLNAAPQLRRLLEGQNPLDPLFVHLDGYSLEVVQTVVQLVYTGQVVVNEVNQRPVFELMKMLDMTTDRVQIRKMDKAVGLEGFISVRSISLTEMQESSAEPGCEESAVVGGGLPLEKGNIEVDELVPPSSTNLTVQQDWKKDEDKENEEMLKEQMLKQQQQGPVPEAKENESLQTAAGSRVPPARGRPRLKRKRGPQRVRRSVRLRNSTDTPDHEASSSSSGAATLTIDKSQTNPVSDLDSPTDSGFSDISKHSNSESSPTNCNESSSSGSNFPESLGNGEWIMERVQVKLGKKFGVYVHRANGNIIGVPLAHAIHLSQRKGWL